LRSRRTPRFHSAFLVLAVLGSLLAAGGSAGAPARPVVLAAANWRGLVGAERPRVSTGQRAIVLLKAPSLAERLEEAGGFGTEAEMRQWSAAAVSAQKQFATKIAGKGLPLVPELIFTRVVNGFSAPLDPRGIALLERDPDVLGVYPVRAAYPASLSSRALGRSAAPLSPGPGLAGLDGTGVTVAVLDTGIDATHPFLRGRVAEGIDIVSPEGVAAPQRHPRLPGLVERHGTQLAGIVAGADGPGGLHGVAPGARILPIRVAGWQPDANGGYAIYGRTDQILAGIERAVDPNGDGSVLDAARIALVGVGEPFAAFPSGALAQAVAGAASLDTLVVAPAGNDGPAGPSYGSVGGPAGAPDALAVGAADGRGGLATVHVMLRAGLHVLLDRKLPLGGVVVPQRPLTLSLAVPRRVDPNVPSDERDAAGFFDGSGYSLVAGRAALVAVGAAPQVAQRDAALAGAAAVIVQGVTPAGALGHDERVGIPVVGIPAPIARAARRALAAGIGVSVSIGVPESSENPAAGQIAPFSSRRLGVGISARLPGAAGISLKVEPARLSLARGASADVRVTATVDVLRLRRGSAEGSILLRAASADVRVPWAIAFPTAPAGLLADVKLSTDSFDASDTTPAVLSLRAGRVELRGGTPQVQPVERLDVELWHKQRQVGTLARLRDVLPGTYAFGITGRGPFGKRLPLGVYRLRVVAVPVGGGAASAREVTFRLT
jgi:hypothetical protein